MNQEISVYKLPKTQILLTVSLTKDAIQLDQLTARQLRERM